MHAEGKKNTDFGVLLLSQPKLHIFQVFFQGFSCPTNFSLQRNTECIQATATNSNLVILMTQSPCVDALQWILSKRERIPKLMVELTCDESQRKRLMFILSQAVVVSFFLIPPLKAENPWFSQKQYNFPDVNSRNHHNLVSKTEFRRNYFSVEFQLKQLAEYPDIQDYNSLKLSMHNTIYVFLVITWTKWN